MRFQLRTRGFDLTEAEETEIRSRLDRLERRLDAFDPAVVDLEIELDRQARRREFYGNARLVVMNRVLPVKRNRAPAVRPLIGLIFEDIEEQLDRLKAEQRGESGWKRKRGGRDAAETSDAARALVEERALLDQALAGDRTAFDRLAETRLAGVRKVILEQLTKDGRQPDNDALDQALAVALSRAFQRIREKPDDWTFHGWLARVAEEELEAAPRP